MNHDPLSYALPDDARPGGIDFLRCLMRVAAYAQPAGEEFLASLLWERFWDLARALHDEDEVSPEFVQLAREAWRQLSRELGYPEHLLDVGFHTLDEARWLKNETAKYEPLPADAGSEPDARGFVSRAKARELRETLGELLGGDDYD